MMARSTLLSDLPGNFSNGSGGLDRSKESCAPDTLSKDNIRKKGGM